MNRLRALLALIPLLGLAGLASAAGLPEPANPDADRIEIRSLNDQFLVEYDLETGTASATNGVQVLYRDATLTALRVQLDRTTGDAVAEGAVTLERGGQIWNGERLLYNFFTEAMEVESFRLGVPPLFVGGERAVTLEPVEQGRVVRLEGGYVTTDDLASPGYRIRARSITLREDRRLVAHDAILYLGDTPVFWFPYYTRRLDRHPARWMLTPGYRGLHGAYLRAAYEFDLGTNAVGAVHLDSYSRRGFGIGPELRYDLDPVGTGALHGYWIADQRPGRDPITGDPIDRQRDRIRFHHQVTLRPDLTATAVVGRQSDPWVTRDFFEDEFRSNPMPGTHLEVQQAWPDFTLNALTRLQVNDFFETVERLPDVRLSAHRQELGHSGLFYESETSAGWFRRRFANGHPDGDFSAFRGDSLHQVLLPKTFFGWLNVTPRAGGRLTYYGAADGDGWDDLQEQTRGVVHLGAEVSFKAHRLWRGASSRFWDVDGLRHILEPSAQYAFTPKPNARPLDLPQFDTELPSLRPLPIHYPDYNAIDSIDSRNVIRWGLRNKLQTKRDGRVEDLLDWAVLTDWRLDPRDGEPDLGDLYSELDFKPRRWLTVNSEIRVDPNDALLRESHHSVIFKPGSDWSLGITHRYTRDDPDLGVGGDLLGTRLYLRFSENWGFRTSHYYEIRNRTLEEQYYTLYRDLRSLTAALTLRLRENLGDDDEIAVSLSISLKAFPRFRSGQDAERPSLLIGG